MEENTPTPKPTFTNSHGPKTLKGKIIKVFIVGILILSSYLLLNYFQLLPNFSLLKQEDFNNSNTSGSDSENKINLEPKAKNLLENSLSQVLVSSLLPDDSEIKLEQQEHIAESFTTSWEISNSTVSAILVTSTDGKEISNLFISIPIENSSSISQASAPTLISPYFSIVPKGKWGCAESGAFLFCENFWEEETGSRRGIVLQKGNSPQQQNTYLYFCEHNKINEVLYEWKSCTFEFSRTGLLTNR